MEDIYPKLAVCAIAKDEDWYINDWVGFHLNLGFDHIYIYDNNDIECIGNYIDSKYEGKVTIIDIHGMNQCQNPAYSFWWNKYRKYYDWVAVIDIDEFITLSDRSKSIKDIMADEEYLKYGNVRMNWVLQLSDELWGDLSVPVYDRIKNRPEQDVFIAKSLVNCHADLLSPFAHAAINKDGTLSQCMPNKEECHPNPQFSDNSIHVDRIDTSIMYVRHFITKTISEYMAAKYGKSDCYHERSLTNEGYFFHINGNSACFSDFFANHTKEDCKKRLLGTWNTKPRDTIMKTKEIDSFCLFLKQRRFDLIYKFLYAKTPENNFVRSAYLDSILAFNDFNEYEYYNGKPVNLTKHGVSDFIDSFDCLISKARAGRWDLKPAPTISKNGICIGGAHRLSIGASLGMNMDVNESLENEYVGKWDYRFFSKRGLNQTIMDYGALQYVALNKDACIVNIFPAADRSKDELAESILERHGMIYYKKVFPNISFQAGVNLNKIFYSEDGHLASWLGNFQDGFSGAQRHSRRKFSGENGFRVYVFVCLDGTPIKEIKDELRNLFQIEHASCHINDTHVGAVQLAQTYFNENTMNYVSSRDFKLDDTELKKRVYDFKQKILEAGGSLDNFMLAGSFPLEAYGIRQGRDIDFLSIDSEVSSKLEPLGYHRHDSQLKFYPVSKKILLENPKYHFYLDGVKILSLKSLLTMKSNRNEIGKDNVDCEFIRQMLHDV